MSYMNSVGADLVMSYHEHDMLVNCEAIRKVMLYLHENVLADLRSVPVGCGIATRPTAAGARWDATEPRGRVWCRWA
jgi:hypothetical protein